VTGSSPVFDDLVRLRLTGPVDDRGRCRRGRARSRRWSATQAGVTPGASKVFAAKRACRLAFSRLEPRSPSRPGGAVADLDRRLPLAVLYLTLASSGTRTLRTVASSPFSFALDSRPSGWKRRPVLEAAGRRDRDLRGDARVVSGRRALAGGGAPAAVAVAVERPGV